MKDDRLQLLAKLGISSSRGEEILMKRALATMRSREFGEFHHMMIRLVPASSSLSGTSEVLDVGCGTGRFLALFRRLWQIPFLVGFDVRKQRVIDAKRSLRKQGIEAELLVADAHNFPFVDGAFQVVFSTDVVEHLVDPIKAVREMARVADKALIIFTPNKLCPVDMSKVAKTLGAHRPPPIERYLTKGQLQIMFEKGGEWSALTLTERSFFPLGWLLATKGFTIPRRALTVILTVEPFLERTPFLRHLAGVVIAIATK